MTVNYVVTVPIDLLYDEWHRILYSCRDYSKMVVEARMPSIFYHILLGRYIIKCISARQATFLDNNRHSWVMLCQVLLYITIIMSMEFWN